ncbi:NADP-dependent malic enzyme [Candidatus Vidania fulgoroideae]|nr:NADP-dependent malic enzyme [Candidatus Vidania fulgoroideae]
MKESLIFHKKPFPGKIEISLKKNIVNKKDLSLAYSPGVGEVSKEIYKNRNLVYDYTGKGNLVGIITNGTAVLGFGDIGNLAAKPVMEGKAALFKRFANINAFDLEIEEKNPEIFSKIVISLENTFGGINLEDIKAPECFYIEKKCNKSMNIPVFHDDQHGTAVVVSAALMNALKIVKKKIKNIKITVFGAGAASLSSIDMLLELGLSKEKMFVFDIDGPLYKNRPNISKRLLKYSRNNFFTKKEAFYESDVFIGLSTANILNKELVEKMCDEPIVFALANPVPEIMPNEVFSVKKRAIVATGRSDFNNQVNNILCFPYIFRAALDFKVKNITKGMKIAAVKSISEIGYKDPLFSREKILPDIFNKNLIKKIPLNIAKEIIRKKNTVIKMKIEKYRKILDCIKL